jgi:multiple RNA-binding domain-containing protein 1
MQSGPLASTADGVVGEGIAVPAPVPEDDDSGDEYEELPAKKSKVDPQEEDEEPEEKPQATPAAPVPVPVPAAVAADVDDDEWLRARTSRVLDLVDADELETQQAAAPAEARPAQATPAVAEDTMDMDAKEDAANVGVDTDAPDAPQEPSARLFVRNLSYKATEDELRELFAAYGNVEEVSPFCSFLFPLST